MVIEFEQWVAGRPFGDAKDFLVLGKGPTYARRDDFNLSEFVTISLNHVITQQAVDIAHMIDFDVAEDCAESIDTNARWLVMPRHPHLAFGRTRLSLEDLLPYVPALAELDRQGRIVVYDLNTPDAPQPVTARFFSSEAAVDIAGHLGASRVATLGVDGGTAYASNFSSFASATRLANGQPSFSIQFERVDEIARGHGLTVEPLVPPLKVFVGVQERELIAARVLAFTIDEHATTPVHVTHLPTVDRVPVDPRNRQRTPFSFSRFLIPELMGYSGRALYIDSDMQVFDDITKLWDVPFDGATVMCTNQTFIPPQWIGNPDFHPGRQMSVMMLDCQSLSWKIDEIIDALDAGELTYEDLLFEMALVLPDDVRDGLPEGWNHLEHYVPGDTKLIHYTAIPTQPWKSSDNPNTELWEDAFVRACKAGYIDANLVDRHIKAGHVRASLRKLVPKTSVAQHRFASAAHAELDATRRVLEQRERLMPSNVARQATVMAQRASASARGALARRFGR